ncbi:MAG: HU family DNA-binding protein [Epsilonproteobacteria bacterium]|nr:HU family DNA-binding protein [Campylobacterota bacterium]
MKKSILIEEVAQKTGIPKKETEMVINALLDTITDALKNKEAVSFLGFGSFHPVKKNSREVYIPGTTKKVKIEEKYSIRFKPGKKLKDEIQKALEED